MQPWCDADSQRLSGSLGFSCADANSVVTVRDPLHLANWTLPVLELVIIAGAVFALVHAVRRWRRDRDPVNLALWFASIVYLMVVEPPLYFPSWFGIKDYVGLIFVHNVFSVQFMYDRLPLYIVAVYPALSQLVYEVVRVTGVFRRRGALVGSVAVAFACQVCYEVFDQLGPQLSWWAWDPGNPINQPMFASVPMNSMTLFASVSFGALTFLTVRLVGTGPRRAPSLVLRTIAAGVLTPIVMTLASAPTAVLGTGHTSVKVAVLWVELAVLWAAGSWLLVDAWRSREPALMEQNAFVRTYPAIYLVAMAALWLSALPDYLASTDGITSSGKPVGSGPYAVACFLGAAALLVVALRPKIPVPRPVLASQRGEPGLAGEPAEL